MAFSFFKTSKWKKIVVELQGAQGHDLHLCGRDMTDALWDATHASMYFAHYSEPLTNKVQVEIKVELDWGTDEIELFFRRTSLWAAQYVQKVSVSPFNESPAHAQAYLLSRLLRGKGEDFTKDVLHWALNMTGYTYPQEIKLLGEHVAHLAGNIEKGMP